MLHSLSALAVPSTISDRHSFGPELPIVMLLNGNQTLVAIRPLSAVRPFASFAFRELNGNIMFFNRDSRQTAALEAVSPSFSNKTTAIFNIIIVFNARSSFHHTSTHFLQLFAWQ
jgi:hypothetical protein